MHFIYHYLDDYILLGAPGELECHSSILKFVECCKLLGVPLAQEKSEGPTTRLTFLGTEIDTNHMQLHLLRKKLLKACSLIKEFLGVPSALKGVLESLLGLLQHAARVVKPGRWGSCPTQEKVGSSESGKGKQVSGTWQQKSSSP